jgi:hypothetical protein
VIAKVLSIGEAAIILVLALGGWFAVNRIEALETRMGELKISNDQLKATLNAKSNATRQRTWTDQAVRQLAPSDVLQRLR